MLPAAILSPAAPIKAGKFKALVKGVWGINSGRTMKVWESDVVHCWVVTFEDIKHCSDPFMTVSFIQASPISKHLLMHCDKLSTVVCSSAVDWHSWFSSDRLRYFSTKRLPLKKRWDILWSELFSFTIWCTADVLMG